MLSSYDNRSAKAWVVALLCVTGPSVLSQEPHPKRDRYLVTLREGTKPDAASALSSELASIYGYRVVATFTEGAQLGFVAELDPAKVPALGRRQGVERIQKVVTPGSPPPPEAGGKFYRVQPGWAIPGVYQVRLVEAATGQDFSLVLRPQGLLDPDWKSKDEAKVAAVQALADDLAAAVDARVMSVFAPTVPGFACAMNERQAREMAAAPRVQSVTESIYTLIEFEPTRQ